MRWGIGIAAAAVALSAPAAASAAELRLGMSFKYLTNAPQVTEPLTASAPSLDIASLNLRWRTVQPNCRAIRRGEFVWGRPDQAMQAARDLGLPVSLTLTHGPNCTSKGGGMQPTGKWVKKWVKFARAAAVRYGSDPVVEFEILSEPNLHRFGGPPQGYVRLFLAAEQAIRDADRSVRTLVGGLGFCCGPHLFVKQIYRSKAMRKRGRHLGAHTYAPSAKSAIKRLRMVRRALPKGADITITETGWSTCPRPTNTPQGKCVRPARQAGQMRAYIDLLERNRRSLDVRGFYWFQAMDFSEPASVADCRDSPKHFYGIWTRAGQPKPSHAVWEAASGADLEQVVPPNPMNRPCRE